MIYAIKRIFQFFMERYNYDPSKYSVGAYYSTPVEGGYGLIKILKIDDEGVHLAMYSNLYEYPPLDINESELFMRPIDGDESLPLGLAHAPISHKQFKTWHAQYVAQFEVTSKDLKGYMVWKENNGGFF
jgi:hypothetical protein